jgi:hypothetical protein
MEDEQMKKSQYINENIISKGYNPEELSNFIMKEICMSINDIKFEKLKEMVEKFKNKGLADLYQTVKLQNEEKPENLEEQLYYPEVFDIITKTPKENKLLDLEKEKKRINIKISEPKKENKNEGLFSKSKYLYKIECDEIKSCVRRSYSDFEWLRNEFAIFYPLRIIPPLIKENNLILEGIIDKIDNKDEIENKKIKHLNKFIDTLLKKKLFRTSSLLCNFLELENNEFKKYKDSISKRNFELNPNFSNFKNMKGKIHCDFNKDKISYVEKISLSYQNISNIYTKLEENINKLCTNLNNLSLYMKEIGDRFQELTDNLKYFQYSGKMSNSYIQLNTIFAYWSSALERQSEFFSQDFLQLFKFFNLQIKETDYLQKQFALQKKNYENKGIKLLKKKEELFYQGDINKWGLESNDKKFLEKCSNEKTICFEKMLSKETNNLKADKKSLAVYLNLINKQFDKLLKQQSDEILRFFEELKSSHKIMVGDAYNLIKLCNINMK